MELLIIFIAIPIVVLLALIAMIFLGVVNYVNTIYTDIESRLNNLEKQEPGYAGDPFEKPKETMQSTPHIIVPNSPDQIRNKNFQKIKEGQMYGNID